MTIRVTCAECKSVLKIKDELAGTKGRCPKCKTAFMVPALEVAAAPLEASAAGAVSDELPAPAASAASATDLSDEIPAVVNTAMQSASDLLLDDVDTDSVLVMSPGMDVAREIPPSASTKLKPPPLNIPAPPPADDDDAPIRLRMPIADEESAPTSDHDLSAATPAPPPRREKKAPARSLPESDDEFDAAAFLSDDTPAPRRPAAPPPPSSSFDLAAPEERFTLEPDDDEPPRPTTTTPSKPVKTSAARNAGGASSVAAEALSDHAKAAKQMMRAIKESNAKAFEDKGDDDGGWQYDVFGMVRELGVKGLGGLAAVLVFAFLMYKASDYMMGGGMKLPELGSVSGTVLLNGQPLQGATVHFQPVDPATNGPPTKPVRTSIGMTDDKGRYRMLYIDNTAGVAVGKCRVWVSHLNERGKSTIPGDFSEGALLMKEIKSRNDPIDFDMSSQRR